MFADPSGEETDPASDAFIPPEYVPWLAFLAETYPGVAGRGTLAERRTRLREWAGAQTVAYPGVDFHRETAKAHAWELNNPTKRKTSAGQARFLGAWYARAQDQLGGDKAVVGGTRR